MTQTNFPDIGDFMATPGDDGPSSPSFSSWPELDTAIKDNGGVLRVAMWAVRDIDGHGRLGVRVLDTLHRKLADIGVDHLPLDLPNNQYQSVVLFKRASEAGAVVAAVRSGNSTADAESALRRLNTSDAIQAEKEKDAKLADLADKVDDLEKLLVGFRTILNEA
ncbi:hypothetical protein [Kitasatospora purpeofusca]|uniref:hypothetical protein n=1 Tax=Kitasatospora purpeofusca TaxID=67352 RepID=UPI0038166B3D